MRNTLRAARKEKGMTQKQMAAHLHISERHYKKIESGESAGRIEMWDALEDLLNHPQRDLRYQEDSPS